jgi:type 1 glutamine amidotransferase
MHVTERQALVVRGGWEGHHPVEATDEFLPHLKDNGFAVRVEDSPRVYADTDYMAGVDLVVQCMTMSTIEKDELAGLMTAVENGTGLAGWHGGIADSYRSSSDYLHLIGGQFACHPPKAPEERRGEQADYFLPYRVEMLPAAADHPITQEIASFDLVTEQYWVLTDAYVDVLATTTLAAREWDPWHRPVTSPAIWTREWGRGRVFVCTPGHDMEVIRNPSVTTIIERGVLWAAR